MTIHIKYLIITIILTKSISRFGRDSVDVLDTLRQLREEGVRVVFEQESLDTDNTDSELMISVVEAIAQAENESRAVVKNLYCKGIFNIDKIIFLCYNLCNRLQRRLNLCQMLPYIHWQKN